MRIPIICIRCVTLMLAVLGSLSPLVGSASHESTSALVFAPVTGSPTPAAAGEGTIEFKGGSEPTSRWTVSFSFTGLQAGARYTVVDQGRFGEDESPAAAAFTSLCAFETDGAGGGGCWNYLFGLRRLGIVQLRLDTETGPPVVQATRAAGGPGSITSVPNRFSPAPTATPAALPEASPAGS